MKEMKFEMDEPTFHRQNNDLYGLISKQIQAETLIQMVFSNLRKKSNPYRKVTVRPVLVGGTLHFQAEFHFEKKATHENLTSEELFPWCMKQLTDTFKQLNLFAEEGDYQILAARSDHPRITKSSPTKKLLPLSHNQEKQYLIPEGSPCDFLIRLGVMTRDGQVIPKQYSKFRQINRFLEIVEDVYSKLPPAEWEEAAKEQQEEAIQAKTQGNTHTETAETQQIGQAPIRIVDFGCGKAYLTFALYYYLRKIRNRRVEIIGLDLKEDVISFCNQVACDLGYRQLRFLIGDIADYQSDSKADLVVTLHACDTATDFALIKAVEWDASVILSVPCCQHELFSQMKDTLHQPIFKHGILKERASAILTDGLRALKLEEQGYDVSLIEFTSLEHTAKNIMLRAVRPQGSSSASRKNRMEKARQEYQALVDYWHVNPAIDGLGKS